MNLLNLENSPPHIRKKIEERFKGIIEEFSKCIQCGKCVGNCQAAEISTFNSRKIIHEIKTGNLERVLKSGDLWKCLLCSSCYALCPNNINFSSAVMLLRIVSFYTGQGHEFIESALGFHEYYLATGMSVPTAEQDPEIIAIMGENSKSDGSMTSIREKLGLQPSRSISQKAINEIAILAAAGGMTKKMALIKEKKTDKEDWTEAAAETLKTLENFPKKNKTEC